MAVMSPTIKALTLWQPWASAVAVGAKCIETRSWSTNYRGPLAIHAAQTLAAVREFERQIVMAPYWRAALRPALLVDGNPYRLRIDLPYGAIVAIAELVDVIRAGDVVGIDERHKHDSHPDAGDWSEELLGDFGPDRWAFILDNVHAIVPPWPADGRQRLWSWRLPPSLEGELGIITEGEP